MEEERCIPCEISVAAGILIEKFCGNKKEICDQLLEKFSQGNMSLRDLQREIGFPDEEFLPFELSEEVLNMTYAQAVEEFNKKQNSKHLT
jgi:hypothetical protein